MLEQKTLFNTSQELLDIYEDLTNHVRDELKRFDDDLKDLTLVNKTKVLLDIGFNVADLVNVTVFKI